MTFPPETGPKTAAPSRPGEFDLIARYFAPMAGKGGLGLLDDAALLTPPVGHDLVLSKDALVAGVHFFADDPPETIARKALRVNLSDIAAKGAAPLGFLLGLGLPDDWTEDWLAGFASGLAADSAHFRCPLLGGDTVKAGERLFLSITVLGSLPSGTMVRRSGGRAGDILYISGVIGASTLGLSLRLDPAAAWARDVSETMRENVRRSYLVPDPASALAEVIRNHARAAMDISDGLIGDAMKLAIASGTGIEIDARKVPLPPGFQRIIQRDPDLLEQILTGGDDYQVLAAIPPHLAAFFEKEALKAGMPVTAIGKLTSSGIRVISLDGGMLSLARHSFRHF